MDIETLKHHIGGLIAKGKSLRNQEELFIKASGLEEAAEKCREEVLKYEIDIEDLKEKIAELQAQREDALKSTLKAISEKITALLPAGEGHIEINADRTISIGWKRKLFVLRDGLSGGEKVVFDQALAYALLGNAENKFLLYEAAEVDPENLGQLLEKLSEIDGQIIINTWYKSRFAVNSKTWNLIEL